MPERIQLRRVRGYRKPPGAITVSRPSKWGNPFEIVSANRVRDRRWGHEYSTAQGEARGFSVRMFREELVDDRLDFTIEDVQRELAGCDLCCWCRLVDKQGIPVPCHADTLLYYANRVES